MSNSSKFDSLFCKVYIESVDKWVDGILTYADVEERVAEVFLSTKYFKSYIGEGSKVVIKSINEEEEYIFTGNISKKVVSIRKQSVTVYIDEIVKFQNARKYERFMIDYPAVINGESDSKVAVIHDISSGGLLLTTPTEMNIGNHINLEIFLSSEKSLKFLGKVVRKNHEKKGFDYGVMIANIDKENDYLLKKFIEVLVKQKKYILYEMQLFNILKKAVFIVSGLSLILLLYIKFFK